MRKMSGRLLNRYGLPVIAAAKAAGVVNPSSIFDLEDAGVDYAEVWYYCHNYATDTNCASYRDAYRRITDYILEGLKGET